MHKTKRSLYEQLAGVTTHRSFLEALSHVQEQLEKQHYTHLAKKPLKRKVKAEVKRHGK